VRREEGRKVVVEVRVMEGENDGEDLFLWRKDVKRRKNGRNRIVDMDFDFEGGEGEKEGEEATEDEDRSTNVSSSNLGPDTPSLSIPKGIVSLAIASKLSSTPASSKQFRSMLSSPAFLVPGRTVTLKSMRDWRSWGAVWEEGGGGVRRERRWDRRI